MCLFPFMEMSVSKKGKRYKFSSIVFGANQIRKLEPFRVDRNLNYKSYKPQRLLVGYYYSNLWKIGNNILSTEHNIPTKYP